MDSSPLNSWLEEKRSVYLYQIMAAKEQDTQRKELFLSLARAAEEQAGVWEKTLLTAEQNLPNSYHPDLRTRLVGFLIQSLGVQRLRSVLPAMKIRGMSVYNQFEGISEQLSHTAAHEQKHRGVKSGNNLRAAVFGINDGLLSNVSLILGMAGASASASVVTIAGIAGLLAGAFSMAAGEYISVRSQRELFEYQIGLEAKELQLYPEEEANELAVIYQARGLPVGEAKKWASLLIAQPDKALETLAREELGLNPSELASPWAAAGASFVSFCLGATIPLLPYLFGNYRWNLWVTIGLTGVCLFTIGAILSLFTNRSASYSGMRMLCIGLLAGLITYGIGHVLGGLNG